MTPQIEAAGGPPATGADPRHITRHGKPAKKSLFSKLMALLNPRAKSNKPAPEASPGIHAATDNRKLALHANKPIPQPRSSTLLDKKQPAKKQDGQKHHAQAPISGAHIMEAGIHIQSEKQARPQRATGNQLAANIARSARQQPPASGSGRKDGESYQPISRPRLQAAIRPGGHSSRKNTPALAGKHLKVKPPLEFPSGKASKKPAIAQQADPGRHENTGQAALASRAQPENSTERLQAAIRPGGHSSRKNAPALTEKHLKVKPPLEFPSGKASKKPAIAQQADPGRHENTGKAALASRAQPENSTKRLTQANYAVFAGDISPAPKRSGQHPGQASKTVKTGLDVSASTRRRNPRLELTARQKPHLRHAVEQQRNSHVRQTAAAALLTAGGAAEASDDLLDGNAPVAARSSHSVPELYALQTPQTASIALTQHSKAILPQTQPGSGPWAIAAAMQEIGQAASRGRFRIELRLEPAHLGKIQVYLDSGASKQIQVHIVVDQGASRQVIEQHLPILRQSLEQQGLSLGNFSMGGQPHQGDTEGGQQTGAGGAPERHVHATGVSGSPSATAGIPLPTPAGGRLSIHI